MNRELEAQAAKIVNFEAGRADGAVAQTPESMVGDVQGKTGMTAVPVARVEDGRCVERIRRTSTLNVLSQSINRNSKVTIPCL